MKQVPGWTWIAIAGIFIFSVLMMSQVARAPVDPAISFSEFKKMVSDGDVAEVTLTGENAAVVLKSPITLGGQKVATKDLQTVLPSNGDPDLLRLFEEQGVIVWNHPVETGSNWFLSLLPWIIFIGIYLYIMRRMQGNMMDRFGGRSSSDFLTGSAAKEEKSGRRVTFDDVAGQEQAKKEVAELVEFLKHPEGFKKLGAEPPRGVLLVGPPGTGKTLLAKALAGEAGVNFFNISASEFIEMFVGVGASRVRKMFDEAKKRAPSIIFIDELDAVGRVRGTGLGGGNDEREQTLNQILSEMDGFSGRETVIVLAATNRPDVLDPALLRPGRFDRHVTLELPDKKARKAILQVHTRKVPLAKDVDLDLVSAGCPGFSGADLKNLVNEAAIAAAREGVEEVNMHHFDEMRDRIMMGTVRTLAIQPEEHHRLAVHEAGHTAVAYFLPHADPLYKVTIIPRGRALGGTHLLPTEERHTLDEDYLRDRLAVSLAGRGAEDFFIGNVSSGADDDIKNATKLARAMVSQWGMSDDVGPIDLRQSEEHPFLGREIAQPRRFSEEMSSRVDDAVLKLIREAEARGLDILKTHRPQIELLIEKLEKEETVNWPEIDATLGPKAAKQETA
ncbi:ATP-dependent zinc metalloprotease FtsH [Sneathiella sp. HT1-7]|uniref:ATP-dependent zinc metalloprotease FtsH n=1 Tax=Sneathiella sp. HT1-7 TaxID=2887192 RepID=UPI001D14A0D0|nr:ATP-dependent zinc metalloprotease FtsH [Sneathiella sp. HT1-7]MCC3306433.1 ATP-dependent zinc metalloprotease FtsH [Sneathiella sp. HT1-7]